MRSHAYVLLATLAASASTNRVIDLKQRYGNPISETFKVRPGIGVTVRHAKDGRLLEMLVVPLDPNGLISSRHMTITREAAKSVIDELVPQSSKGEYIIGTFVNSICLPENDCAGTSEDYEKVYIKYNAAREEGKIHYADVEFKN